MYVYHDRLSSHLGQDEMVRKILGWFYWPGAWWWIEQYVRRCATCQQNKNLTHQTHVPLYKISIPDNSPSFTQVAMNLIIGLPKSQGYDSVLTIVDHGCSQAVIFLSCLNTITGPQIAQLYYQHLYPWFRLPRQIISDQDPCFTSHFS